MERESFINLIKGISKQLDTDRNIAESMRKYTDGHCVWTASDSFISTVISVLEYETGISDTDTESIISTWIFEPECRRITVNNKTRLLKTPGKLYDYLKNFKK